MQAISQATMQFLTELKESNNRDWFAANKPRYEVISGDFLAHCGKVFKALNPFDRFLNRSMD